jgi:hypothetical protein
MAANNARIENARIRRIQDIRLRLEQGDLRLNEIIDAVLLAEGCVLQPQLSLVQQVERHEQVMVYLIKNWAA